MSLRTESHVLDSEVRREAAKLMREHGYGQWTALAFARKIVQERREKARKYDRGVNDD